MFAGPLIWLVTPFRTNVIVYLNTFQHNFLVPLCPQIGHIYLTYI